MSRYSNEHCDYGWDKIYENYFVEINTIDDNEIKTVETYYSPIKLPNPEDNLVSKDEFLNLLRKLKVEEGHIQLTDAGIPF